MTEQKTLTAIADEITTTAKKINETKSETEAQKMKKITTFIREKNGKILAIYNNGETVETTAQDLNEFLTRAELTDEATRAAQNILDDIKDEEKKAKEEAENFDTCKRIGDELEAICAGEVYKCPLCGELFTKDELEDSEHEDDDGETVYTCPHCKNVIDEYDIRDNYSIYEYFAANLLGIDFLCNSEKEYKAAKICIAWGGPAIYIDTEERAVCLYWWGKSAKYFLNTETVDAVNDYAEEMFSY